MLPTVLSLERRENFLEAVPVIAEMPLVLPSSEGRGKLGTTRTTVLLLFQPGHPGQSDISVGCVWFMLGTVDPEIRLWQLDCHKIAGSAPFVDVQFHQRRF